MKTKLLYNTVTQKSLILLIIFIFGTRAFSQTTAIPDSNFEAYLETHNGSNIVVPLGDVTSMGDGIDNNGLVTTAKINTVTGLYVSNEGISDLTGIEDFTALSTLVCANNMLLDLNLTQNTALSLLACQGNDLTSLDVTQNTDLIYLNFVFNDLTTIDVTKNILLETFNGYGNQLSSLDLTHNTALTDLTLLSNKLTSLDITKNVALLKFTCEINQLTSLDVSKNILLTDLNCAQNSIASLDVTPILGLINFNCGFNQLTSLDVTKNTLLSFLIFGKNQLTNIDVSQNTVLDKLWFWDNKMASLDVSKNTILTELYCPTNMLTSLDLSLNTSLTYLRVEDNLLAELNIKNGNNTNVTTFNTTSNSPSLTCITVDDDAWSAANWMNIDPGVSFSTDCSTFSSDEFSLLEVSLFPNPSKSNITIDLRIDADYKLYNIQGQHVLSGSFKQGLNHLDVSSISQGVYLLKLVNDFGSVSKKLVKN